MNYLKSIWNGEKPLWFTFWIITFIGLGLLNVLGTKWEEYTYSIQENAVSHITNIFILLLVCLLVCFCLVSVWRSASNYIAKAKSDPAKPKTRRYFGYLAQTWVLLSSFHIITYIFFLILGAIRITLTSS